MRERLVGGRVADDGQDHVVGHEVAAVERLQVVARDAGQRLRRAAARQAVGMEAVDQPVEQRRGDVVRDRWRSPAATRSPAASGGRSPRRRTPGCGRRRPAGPSPGRTSPSSRRRWQTTGRSRSRCRARRRSCRSGRRSARRCACVVPWSRRLAEQARQAGLALRILRRAGADEQPHRDRRLLVVQDGRAPACRWRACGSRRAGTSPRRAGSGRGGRSDGQLALLVGFCAVATDEHEHADPDDRARRRDQIASAHVHLDPPALRQDVAAPCGWSR